MIKPKVIFTRDEDLPFLPTKMKSPPLAPSRLLDRHDISHEEVGG